MPQYLKKGIFTNTPPIPHALKYDLHRDQPPSISKTTRKRLEKKTRKKAEKKAEKKQRKSRDEAVKKQRTYQVHKVFIYVYLYKSGMCRSLPACRRMSGCAPTRRGFKEWQSPCPRERKHQPHKKGCHPKGSSPIKHITFV